MNDEKKETLKPTAATGIHTLSVVGYILGIAGIVLLLISLSIIASPSGNSGLPGSKVSIADNITIYDLTTGSATIGFTTDSSQVIDALVYDEQGKIIGVFSDSIPITNHIIRIETLYPDSIYSFQLLSADASGSRSISERHSFATLKPPPVISNVQISKATDSALWITWETDRPAVTELTYWEEGATLLNTVSENTTGTNHEAIIQPLDGERISAFVIRANDPQNQRIIAEYEGLISLKNGARIMQRAPDFTLPSVKGGNIQLSRYRGKVVLLVFWSMNCPSCQKKILLLQEAFDRAGDDRVSIITVHGPAREDVIKSYCSSHGLTLPVLLDLQADAGSSYGVVQLPATFLLDQSGVIRTVNPEFETPQDLDRLTGQFLSK
ncbi:MAG: TlpA disulfide reductase family protein [Dehalococcoidia bacterium]|jgi:peroxiredoxin